MEAVVITGAGDVFHGAFLTSLLFEFDFPCCLKFANFISALKCLKYGARTGIPTIDELKKIFSDEMKSYVGIQKMPKMS